MHIGTTAGLLELLLHQCFEYTIYFIAAISCHMHQKIRHVLQNICGNSMSFGGNTSSMSCHPQPCILNGDARFVQGIDAAKYKSTLDCCKTIIAKEGVFAFWAGTMARLPRVAFGQSIALSCYDYFMTVLDLFSPDA
jgi:hypothetical protein